MEQKTVKKGTPPPRYNEAFKAGAVRLVTEQERQPTEVAKGGICINTLRNWLKASEIQMGQASRLNHEQQRIRELEAENRALRKQLGEKEEVIDVLKKSAGILSKPSRKSTAASRRSDAGPTRPPQTPTTTIRSHRTCSCETSLLNAQIRPGWATLPTSPSARAGCILQS